MGVNGESEETLQAGASETEGIAPCWFITFDFLPHGPQQPAKGKGRVSDGAEVPVIVTLVD
jgi:hypothetical protein